MNQFYKKPLDTSKDSNLNIQTFQVIFEINHNGDIDVKFLWPYVKNDTDMSDMSQKYAALISVINGGGFKYDMFKILLDAQKNTTNSYDKIFMDKIIANLIEMDKIVEKNNDNPLIMPSKTFKTK